jgi:Type I restriction enzyme R protein N terminus (HSDR_N)
VATKTEAAHEVRKVLQTVKDFYSKPGHTKLTEADTRAHFIDALVRALGYGEIGDVQHEVYVQDAKQYLDYLLFLDGKPCAGVEAKALDSAISDGNGGAQIIQYAVILGVEWGIVTNGRQWRLYHTFAKGPLADKIVLSVDLIGWETDGQFESVFDQLWLVSKESLGSGAGPETWLSAKRLSETLKSTLVDPLSSEIRALTERLHERGISASPDELAMWFQTRLQVPAQPVQSSGATRPPAASTNENQTAIERGPSTRQYPPKSRVNDGPLFFTTPVKDEPDATVEETLHSLLDKGVYVFGDRTAGRARLRSGDRICFYSSGVGVVADAVIASPAERKGVEFAKHTVNYPWAFAVRDVRYYLETPVIINHEMRAKLDAFRDKDPRGNWSWFVQGTGYVTGHDFGLLTRS